jgi:hypothetical protein
LICITKNTSHCNTTYPIVIQFKTMYCNTKKHVVLPCNIIHCNTNSIIVLSYSVLRCNTNVHAVLQTNMALEPRMGWQLCLREHSGFKLHFVTRSTCYQQTGALCMLDSAPSMIFLREDRLPPKHWEILPEAHRQFHHAQAIHPLEIPAR